MNEDFLLKARTLVLQYRNDEIAELNYEYDVPVTIEDVVVVWFSKTLQNWKAVLITKSLNPNGRYYEVTHNGDKHETYLDVYIKVANRRYADATDGE
jgi:hypothetical protein